MAAKFVLVILGAVALTLFLDSIIFHTAGRAGWRIDGPNPANEWTVLVWRDRFGAVPCEDECMVLAPVTRVDPEERGWYRPHETGGAQPIESDYGIVGYGLGAGPEVPTLHGMGSGPVVRGAAFDQRDVT